jgi:hypothetical protein
VAKYISAAEASRRLGVNEKTIRNWIRDGMLDARKIAKNRLDILAADVEALKRKREVYQDDVSDISHLVARIEDLERKYSDLERKYSELIASVTGKVEKQAVSHPVRVSAAQPSSVAQKSARVVSASVPVGLPDGSRLFADFAEEYGVPRGTFSHHIKVGIKGDRVATVKRPKSGRPDHTEYWLTPEQQRAALAYWDRHGVKYSKSDE